MTIRFSVVVPCYNEESYLRDAIQSLQQQDYDGEYEIVVVDNNSTDATADIARGLGVRVVTETAPGVYSRHGLGALVMVGHWGLSFEVQPPGGQPFDVLITDVVMPVMSGREMLREMKAERPNLHFLVISGYDNFALAESPETEGLLWLDKPFKPQQLLDAVRVAIKMQRPSSPTQKPKLSY